MEKELIEITDYEDPRLDVYARLNETQLRHYYAPNGGLFIAESPRVTARALAAGCQPLSALVERSQAFGEAAEVLESLPDIPVFTGSSQTIRQLTNIPMTRGLLCCMRRPALRSVEEVTAGTRRIAVLENVTNPTNVGAIIRSAAALGMEAVLLNHACSKCDQPDECWRDHPLCRGTGYGGSPAQPCLQRSLLPQGCQGLHGDRIPDALDLSGKHRDRQGHALCCPAAVPRIQNSSPGPSQGYGQHIGSLPGS